MAEEEKEEAEVTAGSDAEEKAEQTAEQAKPEPDAVRKATEAVARAAAEDEPARDIGAYRQLINLFGPVSTNSIGISGGSAPEPPKAREGKIDAAEIEAVLHCYVEP